MRILELPAVWTVLLDILAWFIIHMAVAHGFARIPPDRFDPAGWLYRPRRWETGGRIYARRFRINGWKEHLPDAAALFGDRGFPKKRLKDRSHDYFRIFVRETCRAELAHWVVMLFAPLFFFWNRPEVGVFMIVYIVLENAPFIMTQRYNRVRLLEILHAAERRRGR